LPLLEKVRIELFIPDLPDPIYGRLESRVRSCLLILLKNLHFNFRSALRNGAATNVVLPIKKI